MEHDKVEIVKYKDEPIERGPIKIILYLYVLRAVCITFFLVGLMVGWLVWG